MDAHDPLTPDAQQKQLDRKRKRKAILAGGVVLGLGAAVTLAAWSDDVFADGLFTTGSFELQGSLTDDPEDFANYDGPSGTPPDTAGLLFTMAPLDIAPGDVNYAPFWLRVDGTQDALITIPSVTGTASSTALNNQLSYTVYTGAATCNEAGVGAAGVVTAYTGPAINGSAAAIVNQVTAPQASATPGSVALCIAVAATDVQANLPQGESTTITWQFTGTSVDGT